ncbi:M66 family metalloprotease [Mesorhizobium sp. CAU 1732]|uniref:M66 family metalloprotease n=1 Tax=Mesorhizobium sp. CAU 1732 TaxID=3140358 RepID=UPI003261B552
MDIRQSSFNFPETDGKGPQSASTQLSFPRRVVGAAVGIMGYSAAFENRSDHHLGRLIVELNAGVNGGDNTKVDVSGSFGLRDWSGEWDDPYSGVIDFAVFAQLAPVAPPAPGNARGDLIVADAEITQVIQHFRSSKHLHTANVFPDNSIRLVASKPTAIRLYVDYDASSGLAPIGTLSGELQVVSSAGTMALPPLERIAPRRDISIQRSQREHTLNFLIPENLCVGTVTMTARVFNAFDDTQFSTDFSRTLTFEAQPALPIFAVGIEYTGPDVADANFLSAPTMADFVSLFGMTEALYPIPSVAIPNFVTMTYDKAVKSDINDGCDKIGDLKDAVSDLAGDSDDIVYGLYNSGLDTGSVGGCGGGGVAVGQIGAQGTAAHEVGHALGRKHAPCDNVTRCAEPKNTDDDYPDYSGFDSDSIGEFGFDTRAATGRIKDPAMAHDMMGYSGDRWISPYTYKALMSRIPESFAIAGADIASVSASELGASALRASRIKDDRGSWIPIKQPQLFLRMDIQRDRSVTLHPCFHFPARPRWRGTEKTEFLLELHDEKGTILRSACLYTDEAGCGCGCHGSTWPLKIRQAVAFDDRAAVLVLYECEKEVARWPISSPPKVSIEVAGADDRERKNIVVSWDVDETKGRGSDAVWYLVQWRDRFGTWRGLAPRTQKTELTVPKRIFSGERSSTIRVLASAGIATGEGGWEGEILQPGTRPQTGLEIDLIDIGALTAGVRDAPRIVKASITNRAGAAISGSKLRWYDARGAELGRGRSFDLESLRVGQHQLTVRAMDDGSGGGANTFLVERTADGRFHIPVGDRKTRRETKQSED